MKRNNWSNLVVEDLEHARLVFNGALDVYTSKTNFSEKEFAVMLQLCKFFFRYVDAQHDLLKEQSETMQQLIRQEDNPDGTIH